MATLTTAILAQNRPDVMRRQPRWNGRSLGAAIGATIALYLLGPFALGGIAQTFMGLLGPSIGGLLTLAVVGAACGAVGWLLHSWWWPLASTLPGAGMALLLVHWMNTSNDPSAGLLMFAIVPLVVMSLLTAIGATAGVALRKLIPDD